MFFRDVTAFAVQDVVAVEGGRELLLGGRIGQEVAGQELGGELVEGLVGVQLAYHPIAPDPLVGVAVLLEAVAVGVAGSIEPGERHPFAVVDGREQAIDLLLVGVGATVGDERRGLFRSWRQASQVEG